MTVRTSPLTIDCGGDALIGLLHLPDRPKPRGVVIVAGAPQYRIGSHRQFVLLARDLAADGFPVLRFDYRGVGDSDGAFAGFEGVTDDIRTAIDAMFARVPDLREVVLWGLCDGASAASFYAPDDARIAGIVLVNPWVRSEETLADARLSHYYRRRLFSREFWRKVAGGRIDVMGSARELLATLATVLDLRTKRKVSDQAPTTLPLRVADSIRKFGGRTLIILSGGDMIAQEFDSAVLKNAPVRRWLDSPKVSLRRLSFANHTYSTQSWRQQIHAWTVEWLSRDVDATPT